MLRLVLLLALTACSTPPLVSAQAVRAVSAAPKADRTPRPDTYAGRQLMVGNGGGVTGLTTTYYLLDNGRLYRQRSRDTAYQFLGTQKAATTRRFFATAEQQCSIRTTRYNEPGNLSRFVGWRKGRQAHQVVWAVGDSAVPANYPKFYNAFMAMIPAPGRVN